MKTKRINNSKRVLVLIAFLAFSCERNLKIENISVSNKPILELRFNPVNKYVIDPLTTLDGKKIETIADWENIRRPELIKLSTDYAFGRMPSKDTYQLKHEITKIDTFKVKSVLTIRKILKTTVIGPNGPFSWNVKVWLPVSESPVPLILFNDHRGTSNEDTFSSSYFDKALILSRGFGVAYYNMNDVAPGHGQDKEEWKTMLFSKFNLYGKADWGNLAVWVFGGLRVVDGLLDLSLFPEIDRLAIGGHSRSGHVAERMAGLDQRIGYCIANNSTDLFAYTADSTHIEQKLGWKRFWYCQNFDSIRENWPKVPFTEDGNTGIALIAPRLFYQGTSRTDKKSYLESEYYALVASQSVWDLYGVLEEEWTNEEFNKPKNMDSIKTIIRKNGNFQYHIADHEHGLQTWDWKQYLDFADKNWD